MYITKFLLALIGRLNSKPLIKCRGNSGIFHTLCFIVALHFRWKSSIENRCLMCRKKVNENSYTVQTYFHWFYIWSMRTICWSSETYWLTFIHGVLLTFKTILLNRDAQFIAKKSNRLVSKINCETQCQDRYWYRQTNLEFHTLHQIRLMIQISQSGVFP